MMHLSGMPSGVSKIVVKGSFRSLYQPLLGALSRRTRSQARNQEIGTETNHPSHCASDIPSSRRPVKAAGKIRFAAVGPSLSIWAYSFGIFATVSLETSQILPEAVSSTLTRMTSAVVLPTAHPPPRTSPGGSPASTVPLGSSLNNPTLLLSLACSA